MKDEKNNIENIEAGGKKYFIVEHGKEGSTLHYYELYTDDGVHLGSVPEYYMARSIAANHSRTGQRW